MPLPWLQVSSPRDIISPSVAMAEERGAKRPPCANVGCPDPDNPSGQWNWLHSVKDLDGLDLRENAVCWCNKRGCRAYIKKAKEEEREKLKESMFRGSANDPCLPNAYQVKLIREIWGVRCIAARNVDESASHAPYSPLHTLYIHLAAGTSTSAR